MKKMIFLAMMFFALIAFNACVDSNPTSVPTTNNPNTTLDYGQFNADHIYTFNEQLYYTNERYYIYYYQPSCAGCIRIKNDILTTLQSLQVDTMVLFDVQYNLGLLQIDIEPSFNVTVTPTMVEVYQNQHVATYVGADAILTVLDRLQ